MILWKLCHDFTITSAWAHANAQLQKRWHLKDMIQERWDQTVLWEMFVQIQNQFTSLTLHEILYFQENVNSFHHSPRTNGRYRVHVYMKSFRVSSFIANAFLTCQCFCNHNIWKHLRLSSQGIYGNIYRFSQIPTAVLKVYFTWFVRHLLLQTPWGNFFIPKLSLC